MARIFKNIKTYYGKYDFTGKTNKVALDFSVDEKSVPVLDSNTIISFPGLMKVRVQQEGLMDLGDITSGTYVEPAGWAEVGNESDLICSYAVGGAADGERCFFFRGLTFKFPPLAGAPGDLHTYSIEAGASAARLVGGKVLLPPGVVSGASGNGTGYQLGAVSASQKVYAALHVLSVGSGGSVVFKVQSDDNGSFSSATDRITFTAATDKTFEWKEVAGAITDDYWRITYARTAGSNFNAVLLVGIAAA